MKQRIVLSTVLVVELLFPIALLAQASGKGRPPSLTRNLSKTSLLHHPQRSVFLPPTEDVPCCANHLLLTRLRSSKLWARM